jgi:hypothetical protein
MKHIPLAASSVALLISGAVGPVGDRARASEPTPEHEEQAAPVAMVPVAEGPAAPAPSGLAAPGPAAPLDLGAWHDARQARVEAGMGTLLGWGLVSAVGGTAGRLLTDDPRARGFWEMTAGWGLVNAGLGAISLLTFGEDAATRGSLGASLEASHKLSRTLWLNAGLDVGWMAMGGWLAERGRRRDDPRSVGFGEAMVVQGAALLAFDVVMGLLEDGATADLYPVVGQTIGLGGRF